MTTIENTQIAHLAYLNWQKDGCPAGRALEYWLEAEHHLKATWHLLADEAETRTNVKSKPGRIKPPGGRKTAAAMSLVQSI